MNHLEEPNKHEEEILKFLKKMDFQDVNGGSNFSMGGHQIDACAGHEKTLLIIECTTQQKGLNNKMDNLRGKVSSIVKSLRTDEIYKKYKKHKLILAIKQVVETESNLEYATKQGSEPIYIWNNKFIKYYTNLNDIIGKYAKYNLLSEIDVTPESSSNITIPAFSIDIGKGKNKCLFLFFIKASELLQFSYVARRETGNESYYQRMLKSNRLNMIKRYIEKGKIFPNNVIVSLKDGCWNFNPKIGQVLKDGNNNLIPKNIDMGQLIIKNNYQACWVIDGQHRLFSYSKTTVPGILAVSAFAHIKEEDQAEYFIDINREAKSVDPNLLWDLVGSLQATSDKGIISNIVKSLRKINNSIFYDNIDIPSIGKGKYRLNNICVTIEKDKLIDKEWPYMNKMVKNPYYNKNHTKRINRMSEEINNFFIKFNEYVNNEEILIDIMKKDGFISLMLKLFKVTIHHYNKTINSERIDDITKNIAKYFYDLSENEIERLPQMLSSEGGKTDVRNDIILYIREKYNDTYAKGYEIKKTNLPEKIAEIELDLNEFVNNVMTEEYGENWFNDHTNITDSKERKKCIKRAEKNKCEPWEYLNFNTTIEKIILNEKNWKPIFEKMFIDQNQYFSNRESFQVNTRDMWEYRSNLFGHKKKTTIKYSKEHEKIIEMTYNILCKIIRNYKKDN